MKWYPKMTTALPEPALLIYFPFFLLTHITIQFVSNYITLKGSTGQKTSWQDQDLHITSVFSLGSGLPPSVTEPAFLACTWAICGTVGKGPCVCTSAGWKSASTDTCIVQKPNSGTTHTSYVHICVRLHATLPKKIESSPPQGFVSWDCPTWQKKN